MIRSMGGDAGSVGIERQIRYTNREPNRQFSKIGDVLVGDCVHAKHTTTTGSGSDNLRLVCASARSRDANPNVKRNLIDFFLSRMSLGGFYADHLCHCWERLLATMPQSITLRQSENGATIRCVLFDCVVLFVCQRVIQRSIVQRCRISCQLLLRLVSIYGNTGLM